MDFSTALVWMRINGCRLTRSGWNGKGMWIRMIDLYTDAEFRVHETNPCEGTWSPFLVMKTVDNALVPWNPTAADLNAKDWNLVEYDPAKWADNK